jgi:hypothetical protein
MHLEFKFMCCAAAPVSMPDCRQHLHSDDVKAAALVALHKGNHTFPEAGKILYAMCPADEFASPQAATQFVRDIDKKFEQTGSLSNRYGTKGPPRPKRVSDAVALACSAAFKAGYTRETRHTYKVERSGTTPRRRNAKMAKKMTTTVAVHEYYHDIRVACEVVPLLKDTVMALGVQPHHLLRQLCSCCRWDLLQHAVTQVAGIAQRALLVASTCNKHTFVAAY